MQKFTELKGLFADAEKEAEAFYNKGVAVAGTRLRNVMLAIQKKAKEVREHVMATKKATK